MLTGAHKKFYRVQHAEIYLLDLKVQYKHKTKLSLGMVSKHIFLYLCLPDYYMEKRIEAQVKSAGKLFKMCILSCQTKFNANMLLQPEMSSKD